MSRPKLTLTQAHHRTLKKASEWLRTSSSQSIEASLAFGDVGLSEVALDLVRRARARSRCSENQAMVSATRHVKDARRGR